MADTRLRDRVKGGPLLLPAVRNNIPDVVDFSSPSWPVYLFLEREDGRRWRFDYVAGGSGNAGSLAVIAGQQHVLFVKPAEWFREVANLPVGPYSVWPYIGPLTGTTALVRPERVAVFTVVNPQSNTPLG